MSDIQARLDALRDKLSDKGLRNEVGLYIFA